MLNTAFFLILKMFRLMELANMGVYAKTLILIMGLLSLFVPAVFILIVKDYKRMLAYSSIENMGIMAIGIGVGGLGLYAALLHMIWHSIIKTSLFLTSGNVQKLFKTKDISKVSGILKVSKLTGWLLVLSFVGIAALPPSPLFLSELLLLKAMLAEKAYVLIAAVFFLLTVILFGIGNIVIRMTFGQKPLSLKEENAHLGISMYLPQILLILCAFAAGVYLPQFLNKMIESAVSLI
jgi:hydrogenase-4 component F